METNGGKDATVEFQRVLSKYGVSETDRAEKIFGMFYLHLKSESEDDFYVTEYGLPFVRRLDPRNYLTDERWFCENAVRLSGSGFTYRVRTKAVDGKRMDLVIKHNRMGQDIPGAGESDELSGAEFNSPFEEFSLLMELRDSKYESNGRIVTQKPLAIYVPSEKVELWRTGRKESRMRVKLEAHTDVELDMFRSYVMIYEWIKGVDAVDACNAGLLDESEMAALTLRVEKEMGQKGFSVKDRKPHHIILRPRGEGRLAKNRLGNLLYAVIDYELLVRTPEREEVVKKAKRVNYLLRQKNRFVMGSPKLTPPHLKLVNILGVNYVYGRAEITGGSLWVVGKDPDLFDYFLPERWESTQRTKLSSHHEIFYTLTKDNIHLVWKVSKVGTQPDMDPFSETENSILEYGFNSPFEEISYAVELSEKGIRTVYPRAIYMFGKTITIHGSISDDSRYESHGALRTPEGDPILRKDHKYIIIWGYWNGPDEKLAAKDGDYLKGIDALSAYRKGMITRESYIGLLKQKERRLADAGFEDLHLRGSHVLLSLDEAGRLVTDRDSTPEPRVCNFELLKRIARPQGMPIRGGTYTTSRGIR